MKARHAMLVALAAAFVLTSVAAAGPGAAKQRVVITTQAAQTTASLRSCSSRCNRIPQG